MQIRRALARAGLTVAALAVLLMALAPVAASAAVTVEVNGSPVRLDQPPIEQGGRIFVPLRSIVRGMGADMSVSPDSAITVRGISHIVKLRLGSTHAVVDGQPQTLAVAPFVAGSRTYVSLRFISHALGATVGYDARTQVVSLRLKGLASPPAG